VVHVSSTIHLHVFRGLLVDALQFILLRFFGLQLTTWASVISVAPSGWKTHSDLFLNPLNDHLTSLLYKICRMNSRDVREGYILLVLLNVPIIAIISVTLCFILHPVVVVCSVLDFVVRFPGWVG